MFTSPRDEVKLGTVAPRDGCTFLTLFLQSGGMWRRDLAHMLLDAPHAACYMADESTCRRHWEKAEKGTLVIACDAEVARFVGTLPFFAGLRSLRMGNSMLMPLSACKLLTYVCLLSELPVRSDDFTASILQPHAMEVAKMLRELPVLRAVRLGAMFDPSVITASCSPSLVLLECNSCAILENSMPHLERFICNGMFAFLVNTRKTERLTTALRGCVALRSIYIKQAYDIITWPLFEVLITLPQLKEAYLPDHRSRNHIGIFVTYGTVCQSLTNRSVMLSPMLSYLLRVRTLSRVARVVGGGHGTLQWVVFSTPSPVFTHIWGALVKIATSWAQREEDDVMYGNVRHGEGT